MINNEVFISFQIELDKCNFKLKACDSEMNKYSDFSPFIILRRYSLTISVRKKYSYLTMKAFTAGLFFLCAGISQRHCRFSPRPPEQSIYHNKACPMKFLVLQCI